MKVSKENTYSWITNPEMKDEILNDYTGNPIAPIVVILLGLIALIVAGTHLFIYLIDLLWKTI